MTNSPNHTIYEFAEFRLDAAKLMLYQNGQEIPLPPKVIETLLVLIENRGEIIGKDELMDKVWSDTIVEESNLSQYLYRLRKTLGNRANGKPFIETFRRRGYRFNGEVEIHENNFPPTAKVSGTPHYEVEKNGNVLKLVEWQTENSPAQEVVLPQKKSSISRISIVAAVIIVIVLISSVFFFRFKFAQSASTATPKKELTFTRLTNGSAPMSATISKDGKYFVYHEQDGGTAHLFLQQTGQSSRVEIIPPMETNMISKTFSPDGSFVYFLAQDKPDEPPALYRVLTLGGAVSKILDNVNSGISFSPDGKQITFMRFQQKTGDSSLIIADSTGGNEKVMLTWAKEKGILMSPAWSPDGNLIAFGSLAIGGGLIYGIVPQTSEVRTISSEKWDNCYRMVWTRDGGGIVLVGTKDGDGNTTRRDQIYYLSIATGESHRVTTDGNRHQIDSLGITESDEILAVPFNRSSQIWQMNPSGDSRSAVQITGGLADGRGGMATLPNGRIAYIARISEDLNLWMADADGKNQKQITFPPLFAERVRAAADGSFLIFLSQKEKQTHLYRIDPDGANLRQLTFGESHNADLSISPDGKWIVYVSQIPQDGQWKVTLQKIPATGGESALLTDIPCHVPIFSPDGKFISCVYENKFVILSAQDGQIIKTFEPIQTTDLSVGATWSPDGRNLIYLARRKDFSNLWQQPIDGSSPKQLTDFTSGELHNFAYSTDGSRLYIARGFQVRDVMLIKNFR